MKMYRSRVEPAAREIVEALVREKMIEVTVEEIPEVQKDLESVILEYTRMEREITEKAKDMVSKQNLDYSQIGRIRRSLAQEKNFQIDDEALDYIVRQMIEIMMSSTHVSEVWGEDHDINRFIVPVLRKYSGEEDALAAEVAEKQMKHLKEAEGTQLYEIEFQRIKENLERLKKLK